MLKEEMINIVKILIEEYKKQESVDEVECLFDSDIWLNPDQTVKSVHIDILIDEDGDGVKTIPIEGYTLHVDCYVEVIDCRSYLPGDNDPELGIHIMLSYVVCS